MLRIFKRKEKTNTASGDISVVKKSWNSLIRIVEPFTGAWQRNKEINNTGDVFRDSTLYACASRISTDIGSMPVGLYTREERTGIWKHAYLRDLDMLNGRPNDYQTWSAFLVSWVLSALLNGNVYVLKQRDAQDKVVALHVLNPWRVQVKVTPSGIVAYSILNTEMAPLIGAPSMTLPSSEVVHDREITPFHPLCGIPPLLAAYIAVGKSIDISESSRDFFSNGAMPGGLLTGPIDMDEEEERKVREYFNNNFRGKNAGKIAVIGADLKYQQLPFKGTDAQMLEQLKYSSEQICQAFGVPPYIVGIGSLPSGMKVDEVFDMYYKLALHSRIERIEHGLDEALEVSFPYSVELDTESLLRMDKGKRVQVAGDMVKASLATVNEARIQFNLRPVKGGDTVYMQQQNYSLEALSKRDSQPDPFGAGASSATAPSDNEGNEKANTDIQKEALNGAQVTSLVSLVSMVSTGELAPEAAILIILNTYPTISEEHARGMVESAATNAPATAEDEEINTKEFIENLKTRLAS